MVPITQIIKLYHYLITQVLFPISVFKVLNSYNELEKA